MRENINANIHTYKKLIINLYITPTYRIKTLSNSPILAPLHARKPQTPLYKYNYTYILHLALNRLYEVYKLINIYL